MFIGRIGDSHKVREDLNMLTSGNKRTRQALRPQELASMDPLFQKVPNHLLHHLCFCHLLCSLASIFSLFVNSISRSMLVEDRSKVTCYSPLERTYSHFLSHDAEFPQ